MIPPLAGIIGVLGLLVLFMAALSFTSRRFHLHPEWTRKILHLGMGSVSLCFPWIFNQTWPVLLLAVFAITWLWAARRITFLQPIFGAVLRDVRRQSWGEMYFALAVALLFWASNRQTILFCAPVAILTFADAAAALVGVRCGKHRLRNLNKTVEGSFAFGVTAFCITKIALSQVILSVSVIIAVAFFVATILTIVEAFSRDGIDNLSVPFVAFTLLHIWI